MSPIRIVSFNTLFGGRDEDGLGDDARWRIAGPFLKSLDADLYALQECNFWDLLGERRLHQARAELRMSTAYLAQANITTAGHRFHTAILTNHRWDTIAQGAERNKYHHVLGWLAARLDDSPAPWSIRNLHLDPFAADHRTDEVEPLQTLAAPGRLSLLLGDINMLGIGHAEPDWSPLPTHLRHTQLVRDERGELRSERTAAHLLRDAGFIDAAHHLGDDRPTGGFGQNDVPKRQDAFLLSPALAPAVIDYDVHPEPVDLGFSDHCAVSLTIDPARLTSSLP